MGKSGFKRRVIAFCAVGAMLLGCGGLPTSFARPQPVQDAQRRGRSLQFKVSDQLLYVTNFDASYPSVTIYNPRFDNPNPLALIAKQINAPNNACLDRDGRLYLSDESTGLISVYAPGQTKRPGIIKRGASSPAACVTDGHGNLWVTNLKPPRVIEYLKGAVAPSAWIKDGLTFPNSIAIDRAGNLYVGNLQPYGVSSVKVYAPRHKTPSRTITEGVKWVVSLAVDSKGTLYVANLKQNNVEEYRAKESRPYQTITDVNGPEGLAVGPQGWLYVANGGVARGHGRVPAIVEFPPGSTVPSQRTITSDLHNPGGLAFFPPLEP